MSSDTEHGAPDMDSKKDAATGLSSVEVAGWEPTEATSDTETYVVDPALEKQLLRKLDLTVLPTLALMYLFNSIDKSNLGNAKTDTLEQDLHLVGDQYNTLLSIFYAPFVLTGPFMMLLTKRFGAARVLPAAMLVFGSMAMLTAACTGFGGIVATRWFLGMAESGFYPGVIYYLTTFYKRHELASRLSLYYAASEIAGAFTGLIAYGVFQIHNPHLAGWQYLFLVEGSLTVAMALVALFVLPTSAATAYFLTEPERRLARHRLEADSSAVVDADFDLRQALRVFRTDRLWPAYMAVGLGLGVPLFGVSNFLPQIVARLGYDTVRTNLYTVAPNVVGSLFLVAVAFSSDRFGERCLHLTGCLLLTCVGFIVLAAVDVGAHTGVGYFCCFLLCMGAYVASPLLSTWYANNTPDENQRAMLTPVLVSSCNAMGLVSSNIFRDRDAPDYKLASVVSACFGGAAAALTLATGLYMRMDNRRRDKEGGMRLRARDVPTSALTRPFQKDARWRWMGGIP